MLGSIVLCSSSMAGELPNRERNRDLIRQGEELFHREWMPDDPRSHGGDGLGPVYNDTSCVSCHNLGGSGGGGPASKDVSILSVLGIPEAKPPGLVGTVAAAFRNAAQKNSKPNESKGAETSPPANPKAKPTPEALAAVHAGLRSSKSVVLHRYGTATSYEPWRRHLLEGSNGDTSTGVPTTKEDRTTLEIMRFQSRTTMSSMSLASSIRQGEIDLILTRRNTPPLFGTGLIDAIPDVVLTAAAAKKNPEHPEIKGRVSRLPGGKLGRFGWKGQIADLKEFVLTACAVELGLEVPGRSQGGVPGAPQYKAPGLDLDEAECNALVAYVGDLAAPRAREASSRREANVLKAGAELFRATGCALCHTPDLGDVQGLYSDLLLHDMGESLSDAAAYSLFEAGEQAKPSTSAEEDSGPNAQEWRTPPLWGFRDSGPYLHDGRAEDLTEAVAAHGGEASQSARKFFMLTLKERLKVEGFLKSLSVPRPEVR